MVHYQKSLEDDIAGGVRRKDYPAHQDPKQITLKGQFPNVVERGLKALRTGIAQQVAGEFNRVHGKGWRSGAGATKLQGEFETRTTALFVERSRQLTRGGK